MERDSEEKRASTPHHHARTGVRTAWWSGLLLFLLSLLTAATVQAANGKPQTPSYSTGGKQIMQAVSASIVQIQSLFEENTEKASHGSGFIVASGGLAITNYHVVSDRVLYPHQYQLRYRTAAGAQGPVELISFDAIHDLALVRLEGYESASLEMVADLPRQGDRAYAVGYPLDVGLTLTEGISNGLVTDSFTERLHYAGAINAGMSGGPTLNQHGEVIGINVAAYRSQPSVGFLVPARHAIALLSRDRQQHADGFKAEINRQLHQHSQSVLAQMPAVFPQQTVGNVTLPAKPSALFECAASGIPAGDQAVRYQARRCSARAGLFVDSRVTIGDIRFEHNLFESLKLDAIRFANYLEARAVRSASESFNNWAPSSEFGPTACEQRVISNNGIALIASICSRSYKRFSGLYDLSLTLVSSHNAKRALSSNLSLTGMPFDPAFAVIERYLKAISLDAVHE